jgi:hypothetical protein
MRHGGHGQRLRDHERHTNRRTGAVGGRALFKGAGGLFQELGMPFYLAVTRLEHAEWLATQGRVDEAQPLLAEAGELVTRLGAKPWLERTASALGVGRTAEPLITGS